MIGQRLGAYRVIRQIGAGGMGAVWLAEHEVLARQVAVKVLQRDISHQPDMVERFFDEARAAARIADPGIVHVYDVGWHDGEAYLAMEYLAGESLGTRLARERWLPVAHAMRLGEQIALTMSVAHRNGIIHRDLKPDNLFVIADAAVLGGERVKVLDFGIAKLRRDDTAGPSLTRSGVIIGTPTYMSPEQCRDARTVDTRTDVYALGCVLYHLVCGRPPFTGTSAGDLIASHLLEQPPAPSTIRAMPRELDELVLRCLAKDADQRFADMAELARACAHAATRSSHPGTDAAPDDVTVLGSASTLVAPLTTLAGGVGETAAGPGKRRRRTGVVVVAAAVVVVGAAAAIAIGGAGRATRSPPAPTAEPQPEVAPTGDAGVHSADAPPPLDAPAAIDAVATDARTSHRRRNRDAGYDPYADP